MELEKGIVLSITDTAEPKEYMLVERIDEFANGEGGWICVSLEDIKNSDSISPMDCWRVSNKYLEIQIQRGVIKIIN